MDQVAQQKAVQKNSFFSQKPVAPIVDKTPEIFEELSSVIRRVKILENASTNAHESLQTIEKNQLDIQKELRRDIKILEQENDELKTQVNDLKNAIKMIISDLQDAARSEDVKVIQNYLNLWNPVQFVTPNQVKKIIIDVLKEEQYDKR